MTSFRDYNPTQGCPLPPDPREWLPGSTWRTTWTSLWGRWIWSRAFHARYRGGDGRRKQPYHPTMMVKALVYAYRPTGVYSSRPDRGEAGDGVAFMVLAAGNRLAHRTICEFRQQNLPGRSGRAAGGAGDDGGGDGAGGVREAVGGRHQDAREREPDEVEDARVAGRGGGAPQGRRSASCWRRRAVWPGWRTRSTGVPDVRGDELPEALRDRKARARALSEAKARLAAERARRAGRRTPGNVMPGVPGVPGMPGMPGVLGGGAGRRRCRRSGAWPAAVEAREKVEHDFRKKSAVARGGHAPRKIQQGNTTDARSTAGSSAGR